MTHVMILAAISCGKSKSDRDHPKIIPAVHGSLIDRRGELRDTFLILAKKGPKVRFHPGIPGREGYTDGKNNSRRIVAAGRQCRSAALPPCGKEGKRKGIRKHSVHAEGEGEGPFAGAVPGREDHPARDMWDFPEEMANKNPEAKAAYEKAYEYGIGQVSTLFEREMTLTGDCTAFQRDLQKKIMEKSPTASLLPSTWRAAASPSSAWRESLPLPPESS